MYSIHFTRSFSASHRLLGYDGKCRRIHGHNYTVEVNIWCSEVAEDTGMIIDFDDIKDIIDEFDHMLILHVDDPLNHLLGTWLLNLHLDNPIQKPLEAMDTHADWVVNVPYNPSTENLARYLTEAISDAVKEVRPSAEHRAVDLKLRETAGIEAGYFITD